MTIRAAAVAVLAGVLYTVSPLSVVVGVYLALLFVWAATGVSGAERRWLLAVLAAGVLVRLAIIAALALTSDASHTFNVLVPDSRFAIARSWWIRNEWLGVEIGPVYRLAIYNPYGASSYSYVLAAIQLVFGEAPYGVNLVSVAIFLTAAVSSYRLVRDAYGSVAALIGLAILTLWPTMIIWSVSALRESIQLALTAAVLIFVIQSVRGRTWIVRALSVFLALVALAAVSTLRSGAIIIVAVGVVGGLIARLLTLRPAVARVSVAALVLAVAVLLPRPAVQQRFLSVARDAVMRHVGNVATTGNGYKLLDYRFYVVNIDKIIGTLTPAEALDFVIRAAAAFFAVPLPWQLASNTELAFLPQLVAWYLLLAFGVIGGFTAHRRDPLLTWLFVAYIGAAVMVIAPNSGNIGTLVRHRDVVVLALVWLAAMGLWTTTSWFARRSAVDSVLAGGLPERVMV